MILRISISCSSFFEPLLRSALERFDSLEQERKLCSSYVIDLCWNGLRLSKLWLIQWNKVLSRRLANGSLVSDLSKAISEEGVIVLRSERCYFED